MQTTATSHRRPGRTLHRYLIRGMLFPTLFTLAGLTVVLLANDMLGYSDLVINRGIGIDDVARMVFYQTVPLASRMLPFALLVGCLFALGRLGADRELSALEASGVALPRLMAPVLIFSLATTALGLGLSLAVAPWANRSLDAALDRLAVTNPAGAIRAGRLSHFGDWRLDVREVSESGREMKGIVLWVPDIGETVFARSGELAPDYRGGSRILLSEGIIILKQRRGPRLLRFANMAVNLPSRGLISAREPHERIRGDSLEDLDAWIERRGSSRLGDTMARFAEGEIHRRFSLPTATVVFGLLALPLALAPARFSGSAGGVLGILATILYYGLVQLGDGLAAAGWLRVSQGVWLPDVALGAAAILLVRRLSRLSASGRLTTSGTLPAPSKSPFGGLLGAFSNKWRVRTGGMDSRPIESRRWALQRDVALRFIWMAAICFALVLAGYLVVDILEDMSWMSTHGATPSEVLRYYGVRLPRLASRVLPMSLLGAAGLTVSLLAARGELLGMRASGIPLGRALHPILILCALMAPAYFMLNDQILPGTNARASYLKHVVIRGGASRDGPRISAWYRIGNHVYEAEQLDPGSGSAREITVYELGTDGFPVSRSDASEAWHIGGGLWRLQDPVRTEIAGDLAADVPAEPFAELGEDVPAPVDTRQFSVAALSDRIREVEAAGQLATILRVDYWAKLAAPIACLLLPAMALFFAVAGPPHPAPAMTLIAALVVAIFYVLVTAVGTSLGHGGIFPPFLAGFVAPLVFGVVTVWLGLRLRGPWG